MEPANEFCMVTGKTGTLRCAHLLPINVKYSIVKLLNMEGKINDFRNNLILSEQLEKAYDSQRISFVPENFLSDKLIMKIWDESILNETIFEKKGPKISEFVNVPLKVEMPNNRKHEPFKRCLAYHDFMCFMKWSLYYGEVKQIIEGFGSDHSGSWLAQRKFLYDSLIRRLSEAVADDNLDEVDLKEDDNLDLIC